MYANAQKPLANFALLFSCFILWHGVLCIISRFDWMVSALFALWFEFVKTSFSVPEKKYVP